ncbi:hypothetical protein CYMTET_39846 [Cymbomonas tetramitiformis]|uniref:Uncharacterized protein n=1 Tax=Cymbomonas tetramitiformis TaxID=36881 RepID=A0AAE0F3K3_9CHLO|nr:hypothetical protein CYMTET_39846 [Cymbomonas tetramitiformis]
MSRNNKLGTTGKENISTHMPVENATRKVDARSFDLGSHVQINKMQASEKMNDIPEGQEVRTARPDFSSGSLRQPAGGGVQKPFHATSQRERRHSSYQSNRSIPESILLQVEENLARGRRLAEEACTRYAAANAAAASVQGSKTERTYVIQRNLRLNQLRRSVSEQLRGNFVQANGASGDDSAATAAVTGIVNDSAQGLSRASSDVAASSSKFEQETLKFETATEAFAASTKTEFESNPILEQFGNSIQSSEGKSRSTHVDSFVPDISVTEAAAGVGAQTGSKSPEAVRRYTYQKRNKKSVNDWLDEMVEAAAKAAVTRRGSLDSSTIAAGLETMRAGKTAPDPVQDPVPSEGQGDVKMAKEINPMLKKATSADDAGDEKRPARYSDWMDDIVEAAMQSAKAAEAKVMAEIVSGFGGSEEEGLGAPVERKIRERSKSVGDSLLEGNIDLLGATEAEIKFHQVAPPSPHRSQPTKVEEDPRVQAASKPEPAAPVHTESLSAEHSESGSAASGIPRSSFDVKDGQLDVKLKTLEEEYGVQQMLLRTALSRQAQLEHEVEETRGRITEDNGELESLRNRNNQLQTELKRTQQLCQEMASGRRSARAALAEMASHNARLVAAFAEKKQEVRRLTGELERQTSISEASIEELEAALQASHVEANSLRAMLDKKAEEAASMQSNTATQQVQRNLASEMEKAGVMTPKPAQNGDSGAAGVKEAAMAAAREEVMAAWEQERSDFSRERMQWNAERTRMRAEMQNLRQMAEAEQHKVEEPGRRDSVGSVGSAAGAPSPVASARPVVTAPPERAPERVPESAPKDAFTPGAVTKIKEQNEALQNENAKLKEAERLHSVRRDVEQHKANGNNLFHQSKFKEATDEYSLGINAGLDDAKLNAILYCNRSACWQGMGKYLDAIVDCCHATLLDSKYLRSYQRRADAYISIGDYASACKDLEKLQSLGCTDVGSKLVDARAKGKRSSQIDHYGILGVANSCSAADIKGAYRCESLALKSLFDMEQY